VSSVRPKKNARQTIFYHVFFSLPCALYKTHGKEALCRSPERKHTAKIFTHGKDEFSHSAARIGSYHSFVVHFIHDVSVYPPGIVYEMCHRLACLNSHQRLYIC
jgi:hypothetical protein